MFSRRWIVAAWLLLAGLATSCLVDIPDLASSGSTGSSGSGTSGTGQTQGFCQSLPSTPLFCADFDRVATVDAGFDDVVLQSQGTGGAPGTIAFDTNLFVSPGRSLRTRSVDPPPGCTYAKLSRWIEPEVRDFRVALSVYPRTDAVFAVATRRVGGNTCILLWRSFEDRVEVSLQVPPGGEGSIVFPRPASPRDRWSRVELDVRLTAEPASFAVTWDGTTLVPGATNNVGPWLSSCAGTSVDDRTAIDVGVHCVGGSDPAADTNYDDVVVTAL